MWSKKTSPANICYISKVPHGPFCFFNAEKILCDGGKLINQIPSQDQFQLCYQITLPLR